METNGVTTVKQEPEVKTEETPAEDFQKLTEYGINIKVANEIVKIYETGKLSPEDLDERAMDALKEYNPDDAIAVLKQFCESSLEHVGNKSAFLCGMMKTYRQNKKQGAQASPARGPDPNKLSEILERTGYSLDVTTGQRKYGGPPPGEDDQNPPPPGCEVFCGKIPKDVFEDELIPLFEKCGKIWDLRLMMDPLTQFNRGYCFITFCTKEGAEEATKLDNYAIKPGKNIKVNISVANQRLFVGNIPKSKSKDEIMEEFSKKTEGLVDVIIYRSAEKENQKNRGFAFLEYDSHKSASTAKRKLSTGRLKVWNCDVIVDWADPVDNPDDETMSKVKVLYVRNLTSEVTEDIMKEKFGEFGKIERAKKVKDYGFIHFEDRDDAIKAMQAMNGQKIGKLEIEVSLAKPPSENKKKEQRKREQERQSMMMAMRRGGGPYGGYDDFYAPPMMGPPRGMPRGGGGGGGGGMRPRMPPPPNNFYDDYYDYDYDYYQGGYGGPPPMMRGRRGGGGPPPPMRGRGGGPPPPRGGPRGAGGVARGSRGAIRGARGAPRGRGSAAPPTNGNKSPAMRGGGGAGKRKAGGDMNQGQMKRRNMNDNWGAQPIAQQPLDQAGFGGGGYDSQWYQDSYGQNWG